MLEARRGRGRDRDARPIDVTALSSLVQLGDEVLVIGRQGDEEVTAGELAAKLGTITYEIVTAISHRVPRVIAGDETGVR